MPTKAAPPPTKIKAKATIDDLYRLPDNQKAELVNGEIITIMPTGDEPGYAGDEIFVSLHEYARRTGFGRAIGDNKGFRVHLPHRESFSPDAAFYTGPRSGMRFFESAPIFAVEVRSEGDYGPQMEREMAQKRADYFAAGTQVVWDVDLLSEDVVKVYRASAPTAPVVYQHGQLAEAEPAVPEWTMPVDHLFEM